MWLQVLINKKTFKYRNIDNIMIILCQMVYQEYYSRKKTWYRLNGFIQEGIAKHSMQFTNSILYKQWLPHTKQNDVRKTATGHLIKTLMSNKSLSVSENIQQLSCLVTSNLERESYMPWADTGRIYVLIWPTELNSNLRHRSKVL